MTDPILSAISRQPTACALYALRSIMQQDGKWQEEAHDAPFAEKFAALCGRWK